MLKHVQISPLRSRSDSLSLRSSTSCASSLCGSPEPPCDLQRTPSRASSYSSLNETLPQTTIKVFTSCLKIDIEYKTLGIQWDTTSKEVITQLLKRLKMRHRDPRLFYLSMEVTVRKVGIKTVLILDDEARPAILQACHPKGDSRFCLQLKPGGLIRVHTSALQSSSQYKSLVISQETTSDELLCILLSCYNSAEPVEQFSLYEVCPGQEYQRKLHPDDIPLKAQNERIQRGETCHFLVRRNPNYAKRHQIIPSFPELTSKSKASTENNNKNDINNNIKENQINLNFEIITPNISTDSQENQETVIKSQTPKENNERHINSYISFEKSSTTSSTPTTKESKIQDEYCVRRNTVTSLIPSSRSLQFVTAISPQQKEIRNLNNIGNNEKELELNSVAKSNLKVSLKQYRNNQNIFRTCQKCRNSFKSCEFCNKNSTAMIMNSFPTKSSMLSSTLTLTDNPNISPNFKNNSKQEFHPEKFQVCNYSPVYNIREIRTVSHSFSSFGNDKKILDIAFETHFIPLSSTLKTDCLLDEENLKSSKTTTTIKMPIISANIKNDKKVTNNTRTKQTHSSVLTLMPFTDKYEHINKMNKSVFLKTNSSSKNVTDDSTYQGTTGQSTSLKSEQTYFERSVSKIVEKEKKNINKSIEEVNNDPAKGLGHFVYI